MNWNTAQDLRACLESLKANPYTLGSSEVIVVDNGSTDGSAAMVRAEFPEVFLLANPFNENFARGTNQAVECATGDLFLLLNPDIEMTPDALDTLATVLTAEQNRGAAAPRLRYAGGKTQRSIRGFPDPQSLLWDVIGLARLFPRSRRLGKYRQTFFDYDRAGDAPQPMASCLLIRAEAWSRVGAMDERFPLYFNDADWCLRARAAGYAIWYTPDAAVRHGGGGTTKQVRVAAVWESHRALLRFYDKHYRGTTPRLLYTLITAFVTLSAWSRTGRWGKSLGRNGGETTPADLHRELERAGRPPRLPEQPS